MNIESVVNKYQSIQNKDHALRKENGRDMNKRDN